MEKTMDKIIALAKSRGFIFPGSEIYGGLANTWDYGPLGVELKNNVKKAWWQKFVQANPYNVGVDCAILMNPQTWVASGHLGSFSDPLMDCKECHERFRADNLIEDFCKEKGHRDRGRQRGRLDQREDDGFHRGASDSVSFLRKA
jgi:glycyl-tRNA synthetase